MTAALELGAGVVALVVAIGVIGGLLLLLAVAGERRPCRR